MRGVNYVSNEEMTDENEVIPLRERVGEYIMLRMRMTSGIDSREFFRLFGKDFTRTYGKKLERFVPADMLKLTAVYIAHACPVCSFQIISSPKS